jgi:predicted phage gp36 major capsid-like protein
VLTHAVSSDKLVQKAFGDVHMLSHLMGATNCADLHRMSVLEDENAALVARIERQQKQLRDGFVERDEKIQRLTRMLADKIQSETEPSFGEGADETATCGRPSPTSAKAWGARRADASGWSNVWRASRRTTATFAAPSSI